MPDPALVAEFDRTLAEYHDTAAALTRLVTEMAMASVADVLPGTARLEVYGETNEDGAPVLRIQRVLDVDGAVLFDVVSGHEDAAVESAIDTVNVEYLDRLVDLTGDDHLGPGVIDG